MLQNWPENSDEWKNTKMATDLNLLGSPDHQKAVLFLLELTKHVLRNSRDNNPDDYEDNEPIDLLEDSDKERDSDDNDDDSDDNKYDAGMRSTRKAMILLMTKMISTTIFRPLSRVSTETII